MRSTFILLLFVSLSFFSFGQGFVRSELSTSLTSPWEITYGPDGYLWLTESLGRVSRVDPATGSKTAVYTAPDYFSGSILERSVGTPTHNIGHGTLGLALHPDFLNAANSYVYYAYSYNSGTTSNPATRFKIVRLKWDAASAMVSANTDLVTLLPNGYDHLGGRLMAIRQNATDHLYYTTGDNGVSEDGEPNCYVPPSSNPNNFAQDINYMNGKVLRYNIDGSIPADNPVPGNPVFTRGHRNPQGLVYNSTQNILYDVEHGDRTDDEINVLEGGKNYGWKFVRGYHSDNTYPGEAAFVSNYTINPSIAGDGLKEPLYAWCSTPQPTVNDFLAWCTVAPSDGIYYNHGGIAGWDNSILVVTLKDGASTNMQMFRFKLNAAGTGLIPSTLAQPNPETLFWADQALNGRLRDIALSPDGKKIYLINNGGGTENRDKITVYTYDPSAGLAATIGAPNETTLFPNPTQAELKITSAQIIDRVEIYMLDGQLLETITENTNTVSLSEFNAGVYLLKILTNDDRVVFRKIIKI